MFFVLASLSFVKVRFVLKRINEINEWLSECVFVKLFDTKNRLQDYDFYDSLHVISR